MSEIIYQIVEHDGGWAYKLDGVFSETFATKAEAEQAAGVVASEQRVPGESELISWQDAKGAWHEEFESGSNRPEVRIGRDRPLASGGHTASPANGSDLEHALDLARRQVLDNRLVALVAAAAVGYLIARRS